ncbi:hypothetical protein JCM8097_005310 [Rhodosporidiobolus ruineniae]
MLSATSGTTYPPLNTLELSTPVLAASRPPSPSVFAPSANVAKSLSSRPPSPGQDSPTVPGTPTEDTERRMHRLEMDDGGAEEGAVELPPVDGGRGAWSFLVAAFLLECFVWGYSYSFSAVLVYLQSHDPWQKESLSALSAIGTTQLGIQLCTPIAAIFVFKRYAEYIRKILWASLVLSCASMLLSSWAKETWQLILTQGILCGLGNTLLYSTVYLWLGEWWYTRRSFAWGIVQAGTGAGGTAFPFVLNALLHNLGFAWTCRFWAIITAVVFAFSIYLVKPRIPTVKPRGARGPWLAVDWRFLRSPTYNTFYLAALTAALSYMPVSIYLATYASSFSSSTITLDLVVGLFNFAAVFGSILSGWMSDLSWWATTVFCGLANAVISLTAFGFANSIGKVYAFAVLFAFCGQHNSTWTGVTKDVAGADPNTSTVILCIYSIVRGIASLVMPVVSDRLYNAKAAQDKAAWGRYGFKNMIIFVGLSSFLLAISGVVLGSVRKYELGKRERAREGRS